MLGISLDRFWKNCRNGGQKSLLRDGALAERDDRSSAKPRPQYLTDPQSPTRQTSPEDMFAGASGMLFEQAMAQTRMAVCLADPQQDDSPIVFANRAFRDLTGYSEEEIIGRNCRFLQGKDTDESQVARLRQALEDEEVIVVELLNYRKDGTPFWNALHIGPIYDQQGKLIYFFGSQWDVTDVHAARAEQRHARMMARELSHRMKNMFSVISAIVNIVGRSRGSTEEARAINDRIRALGRAYETTIDMSSEDYLSIKEAVGSILDSYSAGTKRIQLEGRDFLLPVNYVSLVGLILHELCANAAKYGALSNDDGVVQVSWEKQTDEQQSRMRLWWTETGGPTPDTDHERGTGTMIVDRMITSLGGKIERDWRPEGLSVTVTFPLD